MKKKFLYLLLFAAVSYTNWAQTAISFTAVPTSTAVGTTLTISYKYTNPSAGQVYLGVQLNNNFTYVSFVGGQGLNPAPAGTDVVGTFNISIPSGTTPTADLVSPLNYQLKLELKNAAGGFLKGAYQSNYNFTAAAVVTPAVSVTSIPTSTKAGTNLVVDYKYTVGSAGKVSIVVSKNGGTNPYDYISTVVFSQLDPAVSGTNVTGTFTVLIPSVTTPTSSLTGNQNYRVTLELKNSSNVWLAGDYTNINYNITSANATNWTGATDTSWTNAGNWNSGVPISTSEVLIAATANQPVIGSNVTINNLTINSTASLTLNSGFNLTVTDAIVNNGTLTVANNANLIQVNNVSNSGSGTTTVNRNSAALKRLDYAMWSSPVSGAQTLEGFSPNTSRTPNRFYTYNAATNVYSNVATTSTFTAGMGYLIRMPNDASTSATEYAGSFTGTPNNGTVTLSGLISDKFYSVGNPYPSTLDAAAFLASNPGTLYFWRKTNGAAGGAYATFNGTGAVSGAGSELPNGTIQVGQGFIAKTGLAATSLVFTNAMRTTSSSTQIFKTKKEVEKSRVWLDLTATSGLFSQALVGYLDGATLGVDTGFDGKYLNDSPTDAALTSIVNGEEYTIQGRPAFDVTDVVTLGFKAGEAGDFTIAINKKDGALATQDVYLVDSKTGIETDLNASSYTFNAAAGTDNSRFSLKYQKTLKVIDATLDNNSVSVYQNNGAIYINSKSAAIRSVKVFDVQGRLIAEQRNVKANTAVFSNLRAKNQLLIVNVIGEDNSEVSKKVMN